MFENKAYIILLIQSAYTAFCYYNISKEAILEFDKTYGKDSYNTAKPILKVKVKKGTNQHEMETIFLDPFADNWYISLSEDDCDIFLELYRKLPDSNEILLASSNTTTVPRRDISNDLICNYMNLVN